MGDLRASQSLQSLFDAQVPQPHQWFCHAVGSRTNTQIHVGVWAHWLPPWALGTEESPRQAPYAFSRKKVEVLYGAHSNLAGAHCGELGSSLLMQHHCPISVCSGVHNHGSAALLNHRLGEKKKTSSSILQFLGIIQAALPLADLPQGKFKPVWLQKSLSKSPSLYALLLCLSLLRCALLEEHLVFLTTLQSLLFFSIPSLSKHCVCCRDWWQRNITHRRLPLCFYF